MYRVEVMSCPQCGSECVTWQHGSAKCWDCNWDGSPYDLHIDEHEENDDEIEGNTI